MPARVRRAASDMESEPASPSMSARTHRIRWNYCGARPAGKVIAAGELRTLGAVARGHPRTAGDTFVPRIAPWANRNRQDVVPMLKLALFFLVIAIIAAIFGFTGIASAAVGIAKVLFFIFIVIFVVLLVLA